MIQFLITSFIFSMLGVYSYTFGFIIALFLAITTPISWLSISAWVATVWFIGGCIENHLTFNKQHPKSLS